MPNTRDTDGPDLDSAIHALATSLYVDSKSIRAHAEHDLARLGQDLSTEDVESLEAGLPGTEHELARRIVLLGYYFLRQHQSPAAGKSRQNHVLWLIEHAPTSTTAGSPHAYVLQREEDASYQQARRLWQIQIEAKPTDTAVLGNAASFFLLNDSELSESLLQRARTLDPRNSEWSARLGHLYSLQTGDAKPGGQESAALALRELKAAEDVKRGVPWHGEAPESQTKASENVVMTLLTRIHALPALAKAACDAGQFDEAAGYATELLEIANSEQLPEFFRNDGNAIHHGNLVLGRCALRQRNVKQAIEHLLAAGRTKGSPQLDSFGPNMTLAKELLEQGESDVVLEYFRECRRFWKLGGEQLDDWTSAARRGEAPEFGPNLRY